MQPEASRPSDSSQSPYTPPQTPLVSRVAIPIEHIAAYVHEPLNTRSSIAYYLERWRGDPASWVLNWPAFLFSALWCFYRKQYLMGLAVLIGTYLAVMLIGAGLAYTMKDPGPAIPLIGMTVQLAIYACFGFIANGLYLRAASAASRRAQARYTDPQDILRYLERAGGTSFLGLALGFGCAIGLSFVVDLLRRLV